jgi:hypothetical protein
MNKPLNEYVNLLPYPNDGPTRFAFIVADLISASMILLVLYVTLKSTLRF